MGENVFIAFYVPSIPIFLSGEKETYSNKMLTEVKTLGLELGFGV